jgi:hypothetical protein
MKTEKYKITEQEIEAIIKLTPQQRYAYFLKRICDWEEIWTLYEDDCIVLNEDKQGVLFALLFPFETFASHYAIKQWGMRGTFAKCFKLNEFVSTIANKLLANSVGDALVFPIPNGFGLNIPLARLIADIHKELENYE